MQTLFSTAVNKLSKDAQFDFMQAVVQGYTLPNGYSEHLGNFFRRIYMHYKFEQSIASLKAMEMAAAKFSERFLDYVHHYAVRNNISLAEAPNIMWQMIEEVDKHIRFELPCAAKNNNFARPASCESNFFLHTKIHQSAPQKLPKDKYYAARRWEGDFEIYEKHVHIGWFVDPNIFSQVHTLSTSNFKHNHKQILESHKDLYCQLGANTSRTCFGCLMAFPSEILSCTHALCSACCAELSDGKTVQCPFCYTTPIPSPPLPKTEKVKPLKHLPKLTNSHMQSLRWQHKPAPAKNASTLIFTPTSTPTAPTSPSYTPSSALLSTASSSAATSATATISAAVTTSAATTTTAAVSTTSASTKVAAMASAGATTNAATSAAATTSTPTTSNVVTTTSDAITTSAAVHCGSFSTHIYSPPPLLSVPSF